MKILFDHQIFSYQRYGGASKYFCEVMACMPKDVWETTTWLSNNEYVRQKNLFKTHHLFPNHWFRGQGRLMNELNKPYSLYRLSKHDYDVFHQTHFEPYCLKSIGNKPMVTTFHDMNFSTCNKNERIEGFQKKSINRADQIIAVSHNTKKDLVEMWGINPNKITVIHHGVDKNISQNLAEKRVVENPYILYVGTRFEFKNFKRFIISFAQVAAKYSGLRLVCTHVPFSADEIYWLKKHKLVEKTYQFSADESTLQRLYRDAEMFVFPSIYEGFGMPILEAMVYDCPVVLSNTSCFPEIAGDAGCYFDPYSEDDMANAMMSILENTKLKQSCIEKGRERLTHFSWEKSAEQHLATYKLLI